MVILMNNSLQSIWITTLSQYQKEIREVDASIAAHTMFFVFISPSTTKIQHPSMNRSASVGAVRPSSIGQGPRDESC